MNGFNFIGVWTIVSKNSLTGEVLEVVKRNAITQGFFTAIHRFLNEDQLIVLNDELNITHLGLGDGLTPATRADTILENEYYRTAVASKSFTDVLFTVTSFLDNVDGNPAGGFIKELGIFAKASITLDSGTMISRSVVDVQKNENISLTLKWELRGE